MGNFFVIMFLKVGGTMKPELLSPAGDLETFKIAIQNGADAVYMAGKKFGARNYANNFTENQIKEAIDYAHLYGVKVYIAINTIIYDSEIDELIDYVDFIHKNRVDAVIIQDLGIAHLIHTIFPNLEMHASTQMNVHNINGLKHLKEMGFKRVVLARETSIDIIKKMKKEVDIELEVFIHGALCVSFSGQCLLSEFICSRSGNRGRCAQLCRQSYKLYKDEKNLNVDSKYLLSPKDLCTIDKIDELLKIGIDSLKIEGRMKSKEYVGLVTRTYRNKIDFNKSNDADIINMKRVFNRGFTLGKLYNQNGKEFINSYRPNHIGIEIGEVESITNNRIKIKLYDYINQGDAIRIVSDKEIGFYLNKIYKNNLLVNSATKGEIIEVESKEKVKSGSKVYKTIDIKLNQFIINSSNNVRKVSLKGEFIVNKNKIIFSASDGINNEKIVLNNSVYEAKNKPTTEEDIRNKLNKLGNEIYVYSDLKIIIPNNIFIPMTTINNLRRAIISKINEDRLQVNNNYQRNEYTFNKLNINDSSNIFFELEREEQLKYIIDNTDYYVYTNNYGLYNKYKDSNKVIYKMPRINFENIKKEKSLICEIGELEKNTISDTTFNVVNSYNVYYLHSIGVNKITMSYEIKKEDINDLYNIFVNRYNFKPNLEIVLFGKPEIMISKHCILNTCINKDEKCRVCKDGRYYMVSDDNKKFEIKTENCFTKLLNYENINKLEDINYYRNIGINNFRIILNDEKEDEIEKIISELKKNNR